jgi:hypothetical protein
LLTIRANKITHSAKKTRKPQRRRLGRWALAIGVGGEIGIGVVVLVLLFGAGGIGKLAIFACYLNNITFCVFLIE